MKRESLYSSQRQDPWLPFDLLSVGLLRMLPPLLPGSGVLILQTKTLVLTTSQKKDPLTTFRAFVPHLVLQVVPNRQDPRFWTKSLQTIRTPMRIPLLRCLDFSGEGKPLCRNNSWASAGHFFTTAHTPPTRHSYALIRSTNSHGQLIRFENANTNG